MDALAGFTALQLALALGAALAAGFVRGLAGFGLSVVLVPVLQLTMPPQLAVFVGLVSLSLIALTDLGRIRRDADRSSIPFVLIAVVGTPLGLWALNALSADLARVLIALVSLGAFVLVVAPMGPLRLPRVVALPLAGIATGFLGGFAGMPGPGMGPFYLRGSFAPRAARASMMAIFLVLSPLSVAFFWWRGVGSWRELVLAALLFPAVLAGDWLGHHAFGRVTTRQWQVATGAVLAVTAIVALGRLL